MRQWSEAIPITPSNSCSISEMRFPHRLPSAPPSEPALRRLGVRSSAQIDRPIRGQLIFGIALGLVVIALPLYFFRRPASTPPPEAALAPLGFAPVVPSQSSGQANDSGVRLGEVERVRCGATPTAVGASGRLCDSLPSFEKALSAAILSSADCAPRTGDGGTLNYVLKVDFAQKQTHVFPGASGKWRGPQARHATKCVKQGLPAPEWDKIEHQFRYYEIAILATYAPPAPTEAPRFE